MPSLANFLEKFDNELFKAFQGINPQRLEYLQRIRDENLLLQVISSVQSFLSEFSDNEKQARAAILKMEHLYYKHDSLYQKSKAKKDTSKRDDDLVYIEDSQKVL
jgi:translation initiation factor 3 subunit C